MQAPRALLAAAVATLMLGACGAELSNAGLEAAAGGGGQPATRGGCLTPGQVKDRDFQTHAAALSDPNLCITEKKFEEGGLAWHLEVISNTRAPRRVLWVVPHDNEKAAFATALYAVRRYGGTAVAVEANGARFFGGQDPNRNFDAGTGRCPLQRAPSPLYTSAVLSEHGAGPIVGLHTNSRGGPISFGRPPANVEAFPAAAPAGGALGSSPDDTLAFVASTRPPDANPALLAEVKALNNAGINVFYEKVSAANNDCSLSNYAALKGIDGYYNLEVVDGDTATQMRMVDILMAQKGIGRL